MDKTKNWRQAEVAIAMDTWASEHGDLDFIISTGDNFYPRGVQSNDSLRFRVSWKDVYNLYHLTRVPWYIALGNHDYHLGSDDRELRQVEHSRLDPAWKCPHLWYERTWTVGLTTLQIIVIDTTALKFGRHQPSVQFSWIQRQLSQSDADWKILVTHHPIYSVGLNGPSDKFLVKYILPVAEKYGVDVVLSGHDHALEHIRRSDGGGPDFVISGAGGKELYDENRHFVEKLNKAGLSLHLYRKDNGFVAFDVKNNALSVGFYDRTNRLLHNFTHWKGIGYRQMHSLDLQ